MDSPTLKVKSYRNVWCSKKWPNMYLSLTAGWQVSVL